MRRRSLISTPRVSGRIQVGFRVFNAHVVQTAQDSTDSNGNGMMLISSEVFNGMLAAITQRDNGGGQNVTSGTGQGNGKRVSFGDNSSGGNGNVSPNVSNSQNSNKTGNQYSCVVEESPEELLDQGTPFRLEAKVLSMYENKLVPDEEMVKKDEGYQDLKWTAVPGEKTVLECRSDSKGLSKNSLANEVSSLKNLEDSR